MTPEPCACAAQAPGGDLAECIVCFVAAAYASSSAKTPHVGKSQATLCPAGNTTIAPCRLACTVDGCPHHTLGLQQHTKTRCSQSSARSCNHSSVMHNQCWCCLTNRCMQCFMLLCTRINKHIPIKVCIYYVHIPPANPLLPKHSTWTQPKHPRAAGPPALQPANHTKHFTLTCFNHPQTKKPSRKQLCPFGNSAFKSSLSKQHHKQNLPQPCHAATAYVLPKARNHINGS
ncbi:hypothetical protein COO60DRAFT_1490785 [Scenedesmus sp. NREL 46B-D3]|nr:hypothetical protein COO60DRAFT_1490785 [Scenedesmus sp. NREL 46B-D3]